MPKEIGVLLIVAGTVLVLLGVLFLFGGSGRLPLGKLPGDIKIHRPGCTIYVPIATCLLLSLILTLILRVILRR